MGDLAERRMTLAEFLAWDDGSDTRYEFLRGQPRGMAPASGRHGVIQRNAGRAIEARIGLTGPCRVVDQAGILLNVRGDERFYVPDLAVTCVPVSASPRIDEPKLIVEVASPSTGRTDKDVKVPDYCALASVDEVWLIQSQRPLMQVWQRLDGQWIGSLPLRLGQSFASRLLGGEIRVDDIFAGTGLELPDDMPDEATGQPSAGQS